MVPNSFEFDFEQISFNPLESADGKIFQNDRDSDLNYFHEINIPSKERTYINETDIKIFYMRHKDLRTFLFFILTSEDCKPILKTSAISWIITETWCSNSEIIKSSYFDINNYKAISFERKTNKGGGSILIYVKTDLMYEIRKDLSISVKDVEILTIEIISKESKSLLRV